MTLQPTATATDSLSRDAVVMADTLAAMINREQTFSWHEDGYINPSDATITMTTADDRKSLVNWCYLFVDHLQLSRETVASAMEMVDRFLSTAGKSAGNSADADVVRAVSYEAPRDQRKLQLLTITGMYVSIKINELVAFSSELLAEMCSRDYSTEEIEDMERVLLSGLSWRCHAPTALQVGLSILSIILPSVDIPEETWGILMDEMKYLIELTVLDYYFSTQRTSTVALAAIYEAIAVIASKEHQELLRTSLNVIMERFDFDHSKKITELRRKLHSLIQDDDADECSLDEEDECSLDEVIQI